MVSCADFLRDYSDLRDGCLSASEQASLEGHLETCSSCAVYVRTLDEGVAVLRELPDVEPSFDFIPRLQHRIYHIDEERATWSRRESSGASTAFVLTLVGLIAAAAWLPLMRAGAPVVELPPVVAAAPKRTQVLHALFRTGPLLVRDETPGRSETPTATSIFSRYSPIRSYASYPVEPGAPR